MSKIKTQEQLFNRILINIGIAVAAYIFLYVLYARFYMMPALKFSVIFFIFAIIGYILSSKKVGKKEFKNYSHMFLAFGFGMLFTNLSKIFANLMGMDKFMELINSSTLFRILVNSRYEVIIISWLGALYLVAMVVYNTVLINRLSDTKKK